MFTGCEEKIEPKFRYRIENTDINLTPSNFLTDINFSTYISIISNDNFNNVTENSKNEFITDLNNIFNRVTKNADIFYLPSSGCLFRR